MDWRQDKDYLDYIDSGESAAVYIVKNIVKSLDTKNMWVDVVSINTYYKRGSGNIAFNWIVVELFPRKIKPKYDTDPDYNRYLTWLTAHEDIEKQRIPVSMEKSFLYCVTCMTRIRISLPPIQ